jgi:hypothetical protein
MKLFNPDDKVADFIDRNALWVIVAILILSMLLDNL